jgi:hypothetical protein
MLVFLLGFLFPTWKIFHHAINQPIYVLWDEEDSEEPAGWYKATV